ITGSSRRSRGTSGKRAKNASTVIDSGATRPRSSRSRVGRICMPTPPGAEGSLELCDSGARAVLVLLRGAASHATRAFEGAIANDRTRTLARDHVPAFGSDDPLNDRTPRTLGQLAAGPCEARGGDGLALATVDAAPDRSIHAIEGDQASAGIAHRDA